MEDNLQGSEHLSEQLGSIPGRKSNCSHEFRDTGFTKPYGGLNDDKIMKQQVCTKCGQTRMVIARKGT